MWVGWGHSIYSTPVCSQEKRLTQWFFIQQLKACYEFSRFFSCKTCIKNSLGSRRNSAVFHHSIIKCNALLKPSLQKWYAQSVRIENHKRYNHMQFCGFDCFLFLLTHDDGCTALVLFSVSLSTVLHRCPKRDD